MGHPIMPRGLKETSSIITIGASVIESAANTFTTARVDLQLNPLDNEVFIVYGIDLDMVDPNLVPGVDTFKTQMSWLLTELRFNPQVEKLSVDNSQATLHHQLNLITSESSAPTTST